MPTRAAAFAVTLLLSWPAFAQENLSFTAITQRHAAARMTDAALARARAEGECLAGVKAINSLPQDEFQPNIEWLNIRTQAMLALSKPCEVLVMLEAAHDALQTSNAPSRRD